MRIANLDLQKQWQELVRQNRFTRKHKDDRLDIEYGVREQTGGGYAFFVSGTEAGQAVSVTDFIREENVGAFRKQLNRLRKLRPGGQDRKPGRQDDLPAGIEKCGFFCQDPTNLLSLLVRPLLGTLEALPEVHLHFRWNVYPNLAPFEPGGHFLLLPTASFPELPHFPQLFTDLLLADCYGLCQSSEDLMIFFNSRHAGATQDHFHLQAVFCATDLAISKASRKTFGGSEVQHIGHDYPLNALVFKVEDRQACQDEIRRLQTAGIPFNLIFIKGVFFLVPRDINNEIVAEFPNVLASMEIAGKFIIPDKLAFTRANEARIRTALGRIGLALDDIP